MNRAMNRAMNRETQNVYTPTEITPAKQEHHAHLPVRRYPARWDFDTDETYQRRQALYRDKWAQLLAWWHEHTRACLGLGLLQGGEGVARLRAVREAREMLEFERALAERRGA